MKKLLLLSVALLLVCFTASSQDRKNAIGVRVGWGAEISYQRFLSENQRLELGTGWGGYGFDLNGTYQWMWPLSIENIGFNWYAGAGAAVGAWKNGDGCRKFGFGVLGQIGMEYNFKKSPFVVSVDWRPSLHLAPKSRFGWKGFALGGRYRF